MFGRFLAPLIFFNSCGLAHAQFDPAEWLHSPTAAEILSAMQSANDIHEIKICRSSTSEKDFNCPTYVSECAIVALRKFEVEAKVKGLSVDPDTLLVTEVDDRFFNPSKYVWFTVKAAQSDGVVVELSATTQKSYLPVQVCH